MRLGIVVVVVAVLVLALKAVAYTLTGSAALLADAIESIANVVTGSFGLFCAWWSTRPPDDDHPYGHGRLEYLTAGFSGLVIAIAGAGIVREALGALLEPEPLSRIPEGIAVASVSAVVNLVAGLVLVSRGRRHHSAAVSAEGWHLLADTLTTIGAATGLALTQATGIPALDPWVALLFGAVILLSAIRLLAEAGSRLLDRSEPALLDALARAFAQTRRPEWVEVHLLRARSVGSTFIADFHIALPRFWDLTRIHEEQHRIAAELIHAIGRPGEVLVHPDPCRKEQCRTCSFDPCPIRSEDFVRHEEWTARHLVLPSRQDGVDAYMAAQAAASRDVSRAVGPGRLGK